MTDLDVKAAEKQLDSIIEKRAKQRLNANAAEESWKQPSRQRRERIRKRNRAEWAVYYARLAESHRNLAERFEAKAHALAEDHPERSEAS